MIRAAVAHSDAFPSVLVIVTWYVIPNGLRENADQSARMDVYVPPPANIKNKKMKKLKLTAVNLAAKEVLTRAQLKHVMGGDDPGSDGPEVCDATCDGPCFVICGGKKVFGRCRTKTSGECVCVGAC